MEGSDVVHASALGQHIVIVNSVKAAIELFEKRSDKYSDRPFLAMDGVAFSRRIHAAWGQMAEVSQNVPAAFPPRYVAKLPSHSNEKHSPITSGPAVQSSRISGAPQNASKILFFCHKLTKYSVRLAGAVIMATLYGYEVQSNDDHFIAISEKAMQKLSDSVFPGAAAVNTFPILRYLPSWMPGAGFQQFAAESRKLTKEMREVPFEFVKQNMRDGMDSKSIVAKLLEANSPNDEAAIQEVAAAAYGAGADTSGSALASFFLAMAVHPDIQKKAQTEIDTVIGTHRLPGFEDRPSLPYIEALYREVMRWKPVGSLGVAHATTEDDIYDGYFIPKGTTVISNIWAMTRDESIYSEPERFDPDRFFTADGKLNNDDTILAFGFGRRICVGRHLADATIWGTIVSVLSTFNIAKAKDDAGNEIDIDPRYSDGMISHPEPFACSITPRSEVAKSLVQDTTETYDL
ncbi:O-methylsterigmatocystin oxidoreductase [Mycena sanguinolenta]|uniref:O-methylsterigmatocystin oxidoreductase n=1 Tax=Mycena sanguinolenta TaxID=230812 RepID=A0A8H6XQZ6_9AGAR|nr:O-methylsterigmatocystin oxidoreductase [Mycena sanguinolenta]